MLKLACSIIAFMCLSLIFADEASAKDKLLVARSGSERVQMLELFSSESCSSCPPADEWVSTLKNNPALWKSFVPVVFHVDYWNYLDWTDDLSTHQMTQRQIDLSNKWPRASVYTPGFILNGKEFKNWSKKIIPPAEQTTTYSLSLFQDANTEFSVELLRPKNLQKKLIVRMAILGFGLETNVTSGENKGRKLQHDFVVLDWQTKSASGDSAWAFKFKPPTKKYKKLGVVVWVEEPENPEPLQVAGGYI